MFKAITKSKIFYLVVGYYAILLLWWLKIYFSGIKDGQENYLFGLAYALIPLVGGVNGLIISKKWGGFKSQIGKGILFLSIGLLGYWFGQTIWSYYNIVAQVEVPYPSVADFGYVGALIAYSIGIYYFAKASGSKFLLRKNRGKSIAIIVPLIMLSISYFFFIKDTEPDFSHLIRTILDFGTPLVFAIPISVAIALYGLSKNMLGGKMRPRVLYIILALIAEYVAEFTFFYQAATDTYYNAGINDLMFATAFAIMAIGLIGFKSYD
jgi:hypothetical protein